VLSSGVVDPVEQTSASEREPAPTRRFLFPALFILGIATLSYLLGAAVMVFGLPTSSFLYNAFIGIKSWHDRSQAPEPEQARLVSNIDKPDKTYDAFTFSMHGNDMRAWLLNMRGDAVHEWAVSYEQVFNDRPLLGGAGICFFGSHLYGNGDLLVTLHGYRHGLVKLDKDSNVLWSCLDEPFHHDLDVGEDGTIFAIKNKRIKNAPIAGLEHIPLPFDNDCIVLLSPHGKPIKEIPLLEALRDSPYAPLLSALEMPEGVGPSDRASADAEQRDPLHTNCVRVLRRDQAAKFPMFKPGQVLVSMRHLNAIAVLDTNTGAIVWATRGPWRAQHDATFLDNGHVLIFDNLGSKRGSRALEYDPRTLAFPWSYSTGLNCWERGMSQRLPNGNTLIVDSVGGHILEVAPDKELVWSCSTGVFIQTARRYSPDQLHFLEGDQRARP
jgi:hypothetical protein